MRSASPHGSGRAHSDHLAGVQHSLESRGISEKAVGLTCISWRWGTEKSYSSVWELWQGWYSKGHIDPLSAYLNDIANFLQNLRMVNSTPRSTPVEPFCNISYSCPNPGLSMQLENILLSAGCFKGCSMNTLLNRGTSISGTCRDCCRVLEINGSKRGSTLQGSHSEAGSTYGHHQ